MIDPDAWMPRMVDGLRGAFGERLAFAGLQGSYRRGEAGENSDIDVVALLDAPTPDDWPRYRNVVAAMPEGDKACGFLGGVEEFRRWPRHELFALARDTRAYVGDLAAWLPPISDADGREGARLAASALYHQLVHASLYAAPADRRAMLDGLYKAAFFQLRTLEYLRSGVYAETRRALAERLRGAERAIADAADAWRRDGNGGGADPDSAFALLYDWSASTLRAL